MELPLYEFETECIPDYKVDISNYESAVSKLEILNADDALQYGQYIFNEISDELPISTELKPIAIIRDDASDAWGFPLEMAVSETDILLHSLAMEI